MSEKIKFGEWQPIDTAPKDGTIFLSYFDDIPVFCFYSEEYDMKIIRYGFCGLKKKKEWVKKSGFRVAILSRDKQFGTHGNYLMFTPKYWMPILKYPNSCIKGEIDE